MERGHYETKFGGYIGTWRWSMGRFRAPIRNAIELWVEYKWKVLSVSMPLEGDKRDY